MVMEVINFITYWIAALLGDILCIVLLVMHFSHYWKQEISTKSPKKRSLIDTLMSILTTTTLLSFTICMIVGTIAKGICNEAMDKSTDALYQLAKCSMYLMFILRLHFVYKNSMYGYNVKMLQIWSVLVIIAYLGVSIYGISSSFQRETHISLFQMSIKVCSKVYIKLYGISVLSIDFINSITTSIAFIIPLIRISKQLKETYPDNNHHRNEDLKQPVVKISILTLIIIISTVLATIVSILTDTDTLYAIDIPFNCVCILLMTRYYQKWYEKMCCSVIKCCVTNTASNESKMNVIITTNGMKKNDDCDDTRYDTRTVGTMPIEINNDNQSEFTQTIQS